ncbi:MAG TPA: LEA type 2 family protein [Longimicrobiaceae bacterium]|nr:LEA type 2 family protein [Longimicrobiaceae bacterium]
MKPRTTRRMAAALALAALLPGCATLQNVLQPPTFRVDSGQQAQLRLLPPAPGRPAGGAAVRLYARVGNPNAFGLTLSALAGALQLEGRNAARVDFPLGVPLAAGQETVVPLDISVNFNDIPGLADLISRALTGRPVSYRLHGTVGVDAGLLGQPTFGPMTLLEGDLRVSR